jgi:hypothetical protein
MPAGHWERGIAENHHLCEKPLPHRHRAMLPLGRYGRNRMISQPFGQSSLAGYLP